MAELLSLQQEADARKWRWFGWMRGRSTPVQGTQADEPGVSSVGGNDTPSVSDERAMSLSAVWSCGRIISETCGWLPLDVFTQINDDERDKVKEHWLFKLLRNPNRHMTSQEFREAMTLSMVFWGNGYAQIVRRGGTKSGEPIALYPMRPERVKLTRKGNDISYMYTNEAGVEIPLRYEDVFHLKGFGDGWIGYSVLAYMRMANGIQVAQEDYSGKFYANDAKQPGLLLVDRILKPDQRERMAQIFSGLTGSSKDRLHVLEGDMEFKPLALSPSDSQFLQSRKFSITEVCRYFRVPPHLLYEMEKSTVWGSGLEQQNMAFLQFTMAPYLTRWEQSIDKRLLNDNDYYAEHNTDALLRADSTARNNSFREGVNNGWLTRNEVRTMLNRKKSDDPNADKLTIQTAMTTIQDIGKDDASQIPAPDPDETESE